MKLYIYEHCPFSARVRYVAGMLNIQLDVINITYDDDKTTTDLIGTKQVPLLIKDNDDVMAESLEIIAYFLELATSSETSQPSQPVLDWQKIAFLPACNFGRQSDLIFCFARVLQCRRNPMGQHREKLDGICKQQNPSTAT